MMCFALKENVLPGFSACNIANRHSEYSRKLSPTGNVDSHMFGASSTSPLRPNSWMSAVNEVPVHGIT